MSSRTSTLVAVVCVLFACKSADKAGPKITTADEYWAVQTWVNSRLIVRIENAMPDCEQVAAGMIELYGSLASTNEKLVLFEKRHPGVVTLENIAALQEAQRVALGPCAQNPAVVHALGKSPVLPAPKWARPE